MPWHVTNQTAECDGWAVVKDDDGDVVGCHDTRDEAEQQLAALYASEASVVAHAASTCSCGGAAAHGAPAVPGRAATAMEPLGQPFPVPPYPPREWFQQKPEWLGSDTKIGVDDEGRVAGYFYHADQCLLYRPDACPKPSPTRYAAFHQSEVVCDDGEYCRVGVIGNTHGHAHPLATVDTAQAHYADPDAQLIMCCAYDDEHGGYILGAMVPHATYSDVALVRRSALSGDWRYMPQTWWNAHGIQGAVVRAVEGFDCIGPTLVTRPGLPLIRQFAASVDHDVTWIGDRADEVVTIEVEPTAILGGVGGIQFEENPVMAETTVELPGGVRVTQSAPLPSGPQPARTAADVPPAFEKQQAPPPEDEAEGENVSREEFAALAGEVAELREMVTAVLDSQMAAMEASVTPLPESATA